jgi:cupin fold WbuC family metalloprotein
MQHIETIKDANQTFAFIIRSDCEPDSSVFLTPPHLEMQAGFIVYKKDERIKPHYHLPSNRTIHKTTECLVVKSGKCLVDIFDDNQVIVSTHNLNQDDIILIVGGGHGFRMLEDTVLFEIKQGPYLEADDKKHF